VRKREREKMSGGESKGPISPTCLRGAFTSQKRKKTVKSLVFSALLGSEGAKAARKTLVKSIPGIRGDKKQLGLVTR